MKQTFDSLGVGLFEKSGPELVALIGVHEDHLIGSCDDWNSVVNEDLNPLTELPETESEETHIVFTIHRLALRHDVVEEDRYVRHGGDHSKQPTVTFRKQNKEVKVNFYLWLEICYPVQLVNIMMFFTR